MNATPQRKGLQIIFWNTRSVLNKIESIRDKITDCLPQFLGITESWLKPDIPDHMLEIAGYNILILDRTTLNNHGYRKRGGGLLLYIRNDCIYETLPDIAFNISNEDVEIMSIFISRPHTRKLFVITVYRPPNGNFKNFCLYLDQLLKLLPNPAKSDIVLGGDFNIDYSKQRRKILKN